MRPAKTDAPREPALRARSKRALRFRVVLEEGDDERWNFGREFVAAGVDERHDGRADFRGVGDETGLQRWRRVALVEAEQRREHLF